MTDIDAEPEDMKDLVYITRRRIDAGKAFVWVYKKECPECKKDKMGKPIGDGGKVKIRAKEYVCPACGHTEEKVAYEETLDANVKYTCPHCGKEGAKKVPFKRKSVKGVKTLRVVCDHCGGNIDITKKMAEKK